MQNAITSSGALPKDFAYVIEELLTGRPDVSDQEAYYNEIIRSVIRTGRAPELVIAFCNLIRRLVVDHLHVVGDIFDRGPYPNLIMDTLMQHHPELRVTHDHLSLQLELDHRNRLVHFLIQHGVTHIVLILPVIQLKAGGTDDHASPGVRDG